MSKESGADNDSRARLGVWVNMLFTYVVFYLCCFIVHVFNT